MCDHPSFMISWQSVARGNTVTHRIVRVCRKCGTILRKG